MSCSLPTSCQAIAVIAYYYLSPIENVDQEVLVQKEFLSSRDARSRIYVSEQGINAQMSASRQAAAEYIEWMNKRFPGANIDFKLHYSQEHAFPRLTIKRRKELVALGCDVSLDKRGSYMSPKEWGEALDDDAADKVVLDIRNDYEWKLGHFKGSELFKCQTFREFAHSVEDLKKKIKPTTKVLMCCTGGIRCEIFSSLLIKEGITNVFQLRGGIIRYGFEEKSKHWLGNLFVFDDRLSVPISEEKAPRIGTCHHCGEGAETYYNCANIDCNELFLCCPSCLHKHLGCCREACREAPRMRPYSEVHKPFRRRHHYQVKKADENGVQEGAS